MGKNREKKQFSDMKIPTYGMSVSQPSDGERKSPPKPTRLNGVLRREIMIGVGDM